MNLPEIYLDTQKINLEIDGVSSLAFLVSLLDRALISENRRISKVNSGYENIYSPENFSKKISDFDKITLMSSEILKNGPTVVVTFSIGKKYDKMSKISHPLMENYSRQIGADFKVINKEKLHMCGISFEKWQMFEMFFKYDRIFYMDSDILISPACPDVFTVVPRNMIGGFIVNYDGKRNEMIFQPQVSLKDMDFGRCGTYLNSSIGIYSWLHMPLFEKTEIKKTSTFEEQAIYNYRIQKLGFEVCSLPLEFNHMSLSNNEKSDSFIFNYPGGDFRDISDKNKQMSAKTENMEKDAEILKKIKHKKHIYFLLEKPVDNIGNIVIKTPEYRPEKSMIERDYKFKDDHGTLSSDTVLLPMMILKEDYNHIPIGDAVLSIPIAKEAGLRLYLPHNFNGDLVSSLIDDPEVKITRKLKENTRISPIISVLMSSSGLSLFMDNWDSKQLITQYGYNNITEYCAIALGIKLKNPAPYLKRPAEEIKNRIIIFPKGSVKAKSMNKLYYSKLVDYLTSKGFQVLSGDTLFLDPIKFSRFIANAEFVIGVSTGPMHLAAAMGIKTVALCIGVSKWIYRPLQRNVKILVSDCDRCWRERASTPVCNEDFPYCQKLHPPEEIYMTIKKFNND